MNDAQGKHSSVLSQWSCQTEGECHKWEKN